MAVNGNHNARKGRQWKAGIVNVDEKGARYLTAETFLKINVTGTAMKKKQVWTIEEAPTSAPAGKENEEILVYIWSHLGRFLTTEKYGDTDTKSLEDASPEGHEFLVTYASGGEWQFFHKTHKLYLARVGDNVKCIQEPGPGTKWNIQLDVHPQINLYNAKRKRYVHLKTDQLECTESIPWGADALVMLDFADGKYSLKSCDNRYLSQDGTLLTDLEDTTKFTIETHSGYLAFKGVDGRYLAGVGAGILKTKNKTVSLDEQFIIEDSHLQVQIVSPNGKSVSVKQGLDVTANQPKELENIEDTEIFQMEYDKETDSWAFQTYKEKYWRLITSMGTFQIETDKTKDSMFKLEWQSDGTVGIKGANDKYVSNKRTGILHGDGDDLADVNKFVINIVNRPLLILKGEHGFVGTKGKQVVCNSPKYDTLTLVCLGDNTYNLKDRNGLFLAVDDSQTVVLDETAGTDFHFQFCGNSRLAIRQKNGNYLQGGQNGLIKAVATELGSASCNWEF